MSDSSDRNLLAAEYVLGVLQGEEMATAERLRASDADFAAAILYWEERLAPLGALADPAATPPGLWDRIDAATTPAPSATSSAALWHRIDRTTTPPSQPPASATHLALRRRLRVWQMSTGVALALAASLAAFIVVRPPAPVPGPVRMAVLAPMTGAAPQLVATIGSDDVLSIRSSGTITVPDGRDLELWALSPGETRPRSLGVLPAGGKQLVASLAPDAQLLVSVEPLGGSPTGQPTGPVVYGGRLTRVE
jgi:anti-sigma-K factor RskA